MLLLDFTLVVMMGVCIAYCWILNRRIQNLQNSRIEFARIVKELNVSIAKAANSVTDLNELSTVTHVELKANVECARKTIQELAMMNDFSQALIDKLDKCINAEASLCDTNQTANDEQTNKLLTKQISHGFFSEEDLNVDVSNTEKGVTSTFNTAKAEELCSKQSAKVQGKVDYGNINTIATKRPHEPINLTQDGYYDSLRKINTKK